MHGSVNASESEIQTAVKIANSVINVTECCVLPCMEKAANNPTAAKVCCRTGAILQLLGAGAMYTTAAVLSHYARSETDDIHVQQKLFASTVTCGIAASGAFLGAIIAPFSKVGASRTVALSMRPFWFIANAPTWVSLAIEDNTTGVTPALLTSALLSHLAIVPEYLSTCCINATVKINGEEIL